jgi:hypothetical protein
MNTDGSQDNSIGIATGCGLDGREIGVRVPVGVTIFSSPRRADVSCGLPSLLANGYRGLFPGVNSAGAWNWALSLDIGKLDLYTLPYDFRARCLGTQFCRSESPTSSRREREWNMIHNSSFWAKGSSQRHQSDIHSPLCSLPGPPESGHF